MNDELHDDTVKKLASAALYFHMKEDNKRISLWYQCERQVDRSYCTIEDGKEYTYGQLHSFRCELIALVYNLALCDKEVKQRAEEEFKEYGHIK